MINNNGLIVGRSQFSGGWYNYKGWVGLAGFTGLVDLNSVCDPAPFVKISEAIGLNDRDVIAGVGLISTSTLEIHGVLLVPNE